MRILEVTKKLLAKYPLSENVNWGERGLFYNPGNKFSKGAYVLTFKERDGKNDSASKINRGGGIYRLNFKVSKETYLKLFKFVPKRPPAGGVVNTGHDFTKFDEITPHPVYGWQTWVSVLNPSIKTFEHMESQGYFEEAYQAAVVTMDKKLRAKKKGAKRISHDDVEQKDEELAISTQSKKKHKSDEESVRHKTASVESTTETRKESNKDETKKTRAAKKQGDGSKIVNYSKSFVNTFSSASSKEKHSPPSRDMITRKRR